MILLVTKRTKASVERRCQAKTKRGEPCRATVVGPDGLCSAHSGRQNMRELGRKGGKARRAGVVEQLPAGERESLRQHLRANLAPASVLEAMQRSLAGGNESARVAAVKLLADLELYRKEGDECPRCAAIKAEGPDVQERIAQRLEAMVEYAVRDEIGHPTHPSRKAQIPEEEHAPISRAVRRAVRKGLVGHEDGLDAAVEVAWGKVIDALADGTVLLGDVSGEEARPILEGLEGVGLLVPRGRVAELERERDEALARLQEFQTA
jgi:hypothetical protein